MIGRHTHIVMNGCIYLLLLILRYLQYELPTHAMLNFAKVFGTKVTSFSCRCVQLNRIVTVR